LSYGPKIIVKIVLHGDSLVNEMFVSVVIKTEDVLVDVPVVLSQNRRAAIPRLGEAAKGVTNM
jgi:hypothetical protein